MDVIRETTIEERMTWGECSVCHAKHGERCDNTIGIPIGRNVDGMPPAEGAHLVRLQNAPMRVRMVPA